MGGTGLCMVITKMNLREIGFGTIDRIYLAWGNVHLHSL